MRKSLIHFFMTVLAYVPYPIGVAWGRWAAGNAWVRRLFFARDIRLIKDLYQDTCGIPFDDGAVHKLLTAKILKRWRVYKISKFSDQELDRYVRVTGLDRVREADRSGQGAVLAAAHFVAVGCVGPFLARLDFDVQSLRRSRAKLNPSGSPVQYTYVGGKSAVSAFTEVARTLRSGRIIFALLDGLQGKGTVVRPFLGRNCHFRRGLVELARDQGAAIVPVSVRADLDGRILIDFHEPLSDDIADVPSKEAVADIVGQYAAFLDATIRTYPWCFDPVRLDLFLRRTGADESENAAPAAAS